MNILKRIEGIVILCLCLFFVYDMSAEEGKTTMTYKHLNSEELNKYRLELKRDLDKEFGAEFIRTTNLQHSLINKYGFDGIKLIFESRNSDNYHVLGLFPSESPWFHLNNKSMPEVIEAVFEPINTQVPELVRAMKERVKFIYVEQNGAVWTLHYLLSIQLYDEREYFRIYSGGMPNPNAVTNKSLIEFNWSIPKDLKEFYTIHDGFGEYDSTFILNSEQITVMAKMMNPIVKEQEIKPEGYQFDDLLEFFPDGSGNAQSFIRTGNENNSTVDWDHETWEISEHLSFYDFIDERMSELDEE